MARSAARRQREDLRERQHAHDKERAGDERFE
jgi:hypothetical protein